MENFITLTISFLMMFYLYLLSFNLNSYFKNGNSLIFVIISTFVFTFLLIAVALMFIDIMTISGDKEFLDFKEKCALNFIFLFEIFIMFIIPTLYLYFFEMFNDNAKTIKKFKVKKKSIYLVYIISIFTVNLFYLTISSVSHEVFTNNGFSEKVPQILAFYAKIDTGYDKIVYFNFSLIMMIGKFLIVTYMPYGMTKYIYDLIYNRENNELHRNNHIINEEIYNPSELIPNDTSRNNSNRSICIENSNVSSSEEFFSKESSDSSINKSKISLEMDEKYSKSNDSNISIFTRNSDHDNEDDEPLLRKQIIKKNRQNKFSKVEEYITLVENYRNVNLNTNPIQQNKPLLTTYELRIQIKKNLLNPVLNSYFYLYILLCVLIIIGIIGTRVKILYMKLMFNLCGTDCGLLVHRYDNVYTLEFLDYYIASISKYFNIIKLDFLFFTYLLFFAILTIYKAFQIKGISFLWMVSHKLDSGLQSHVIIKIYGIILLTGIVLLYDFINILPDYLRFNGLDLVCDYTLLNKPYCGISFYGLFFTKISMNFHLFMYWELISIPVFIINSVVCFFSLVIRPITNSLLFSSHKLWKIKNENLKFI